MKRILGIILLILDLCLLNLWMGWDIYRGYYEEKYKSRLTDTMLPETIVPAQTDNNLALRVQELENWRVEVTNKAGESGQVSVTPAPTQKPTATPVVKTTTQKTTQTISYVAIAGSGSTTANDWQNVSGTEFYFDPADYSGLVSVYFEANMKLFNGNGTAYVRLYDVTHGIGVQGSEVQTNSQTDTVVNSGQVAFWSGKNLIRVQIKSLTADTAVFNSGRLRITQVQ